MRRQRPALLLLFLVLLAVVPGHARCAEYWLRISLNHEALPWFARVLRDDQGRYYFRLLDLIILGIPMSEPSVIHDDGEHFYSITDIPGYRIHVDPAAGYVHVIQVGTRPQFSARPVLLVDLDVDGGPSGSGPVAVANRAGALLVPAAALQELGIRTDNLPLNDGGVPIEALAGDEYAFDGRTMRLWFRVAPEQRMERRMTPRRQQALAPLPGILSASVDYDVSGGDSQRGDAWRTTLLGENLARDFGYCRNRAYQTGKDDPWRRLDSYCGYDWPSRPVSLQVGDAISRTDSLGQAVHYGGIRFGTDYALMPAANLQPDMILSGTARVPSMLELWVNHSLALQQAVGPGPFVVDQVPTVNGAGDLHLVLLDALGRREEISRPYYTDPNLLRAGLGDWSVETGRLRDNYGMPGDAYTDAMGIVGGRYGVRDWLTLTARAEYQQGALLAGGGGATLRAGLAGIVEAGALASAGHDGSRGNLLELAFSRRTDRYSFGLRYSATTDRFRQIGYDMPGSAPAHLAQASVGVQLPAHLSLSAGAFHETLHDGPATTLYTAGLGARVFRGGQLAFNVVVPESGSSGNFYGLSFTLALGARTSASTAVSRQGGTTGEQYNLQRSLPAGPGIGYRIEGNHDATGTSTTAATVQMQNDLAYLELGAADNDGVDAARGRLAGSVLLTEESVRAIRRDDTAAIVHIPAAGVRVYRDNQLVTTTDANGNAVLFGLRPYEANRIGFAPGDLPMNASTAASEMVLAPGRHQTVLASFAVDVENTITANLVDAGGVFLPAGAQVYIGDRASDTALGFQGLLYLRQDQPQDVAVRIRWAGHQCSARIPAPPAGAAVWHAGQIVCRENGP